MAKKITTLQEIFIEQLKDLYSAEIQITKALPKMAKAATSPDFALLKSLVSATAP